MSSEGARRTPRRDSDPVRTYPDGRLAYYTGGRAGDGKRTWERHGTEEAAELRAAELRTALRRVLPGEEILCLTDSFQLMLNQMRSRGEPEGTIRQYKSNFNVWVAPIAGEKLVPLVTVDDWSLIFEHASLHGSPGTVRLIARTLNAWISFASARRQFSPAGPFCSYPEQRQALVREFRESAVDRTMRDIRARGDKGIELAMCPDPDDVEEMAAAVENAYPGYGGAFVRLAFASGLRIRELLALRYDSIDVSTGFVTVDWQLDLYNPWPALRLPKSGKQRTSFLWTEYRPVAEELIDDACHRRSKANADDLDDGGWLFPRFRSERAWAAQAGNIINRALRETGLGWTAHWLRHGFASWGLAPESVGGFGLDVTSVQGWMGHARSSTTTDTYVQPTKAAHAITVSATARRPGLVVPGRDA